LYRQGSAKSYPHQLQQGFQAGGTQVSDFAPFASLLDMAGRHGLIGKKMAACEQWDLEAKPID